MYMKISRKLFACGLFLLLIVAMTGCAVIGQDKLNLFDDESKIAQDGDSYTFVNRQGLDDSDAENQVGVRYDGFTGDQTLWTLDVKEDTTAAFDIDSQIDRGEFKAVLVTPDQRVVIVASGNQQGLKSLSLTQGRYAFKIVGRKAGGQIKISIQDNPALVIKKLN